MSNSVVAFTIAANGNLSYGRFTKGLANIYEALDCTGIEAVRLKDAVMYIDDEGKFKDKPRLNKIATIIAWINGLPVTDWIAGNAIIFGTVSPNGEMDGEDYDCPETMFKLFEKFIDLTDEGVDTIINNLRWAIPAGVVERQTR
jgi:hypothetical protein